MSSSRIWDYFEKVPGETMACCLICKKEYSYKTSITNLKKHLSFKHISAYENFLNSNQIGEDDSNEKPQELVQICELVDENYEQVKSLPVKFNSPGERASHPSAEQVETLVAYLEQNPYLAQGFPKSLCGRQQAREHWERLSFQLNTLTGSYKTSKQWCKYWSDKKASVKRKKFSLQTEITTGNGDEAFELSEIEERILALAGEADFLNNDPEADDSLEKTDVSEVDKTEEDNIEDSADKLAHQSEDEHDPLLGNEDLPEEKIRDITEESRQYLKEESQDRRPFRSKNTSTSHVKLRSSSRRSSAAHPYFIRSSKASQQRKRPLENSRIALERIQSTPINERLLRIEEQRLELDRRNAERSEERDRLLIESLALIGDRMLERDRKIAEAFSAIGEGLKYLAEAISKR